MPGGACALTKLFLQPLHFVNQTEDGLWVGGGDPLTKLIIMLVERRVIADAYVDEVAVFAVFAHSSNRHG